MKLGRLREWVGLLLCGLAAQAPAATLISQGPDQVTGSNMSEFVVAESFSLSDSYGLTGLRFWALLAAAPTDYSGNIYWAIHGNAGGSPGALLSSGTQVVAESATGAPQVFELDEYQFDLALNLQLAAGDYWLALHNGPLASSDFSDMYWESSDSGSGPAGHYNKLGDQPDFAWLDTGGEHAFALFGNRIGDPNPVPLPASLLLGLAALGATGAAGRRPRVESL